MLYQQTRPFWRRHPIATATTALMAYWWIANGWYEALSVVALAGLLIFAARRRRVLAIRDAGLRARADYEHRLSLAGDQRGLYGRYPPVQAGWFPDPGSGCRIRYFDGIAWTPYTWQR